MALEELNGLGVQAHYGPRSTTGKFGAEVGQSLLKIAVLDIDVPKAEGIAASAWAVTGLDHVVEAGSIFLSADLVVETAFNTLTALTIGTYAASDGTTGIDPDGLVTAANSALEAINAVGDRVVGSGAQLVTGTAGLGALASDAVIRVLYTGSAPTTGKARLIVQYLAPTP